MKKTQTQWQMDQNRQERAAELAESIIGHHGIVEPPIDPVVLARRLCRKFSFVVIWGMLSPWDAE
jgi:4-aminobutyrate aminotransferase-like enzyme